ncbi:MAG TPA: alpha/beta hydrolase [Candidatus Dormibacteraeota bacterium]|nr:alpha/beta hydrolase [Candidatus Dormibacteraeota bacterium]
MNATRPNLLFLPGLACDAAVWAYQTRHFSQLANVRVADYGASDSLQEMAQVATRGATERFAIAAHSMGGRVAFEIVRNAPERVAGLALLDTAYRPRSAGEAGERELAERMALLEIAETQGMRAMACAWMQKIVHPDRLNDEPLIHSILDMFDRKATRIFRAQVTALLNRPDAAPVLRTICRPTLVLCGREDAWSPVVQHEEIAAKISGSKLEIIERCGHMAPMERPEEVTAALQKWFAELLAEA